MSSTDVVVTGYGATTPLGGDAASTWDALLAGRSGVSRLETEWVERFDLPVRSGTRVESLAWDGARYVLRVADRRFEADNVVVTTGPFQRPKVPEAASRLSPASSSVWGARKRQWRTRSSTISARR